MKKKAQKKPGQGFFKRWSAKLHLWFGLAVGFLIFVISFTGALYVFKDEVQDFSRREVIHHHETTKKPRPVLPIKHLERLVEAQAAQKYLPNWVEVPLDSSKSYKFVWFEQNPAAWNYFDEFPIYKTAYVNPYSGRVLGLYDERNGFFNIVKYIHWSFLFNSSWGKYLTGIPVLIFVLMLITGIVLWWPKNKAARKQRTWFRWKNGTKWRRKNYDLHNILGFYSSVFALILSITGLFYTFFIVQAAIYFIFSGGSTVYPDFSKIKTSAPQEQRTEQTLDRIAARVRTLYPNAASFSLSLGNKHLTNFPQPNFSVYVRHLDYSFHKSSTLIFDENSGKLLHRHDPADKNFGEKMINANYDLHVGDILGLPTKILAFLVSLVICSMPVTGFLIWWGRRKKAKPAAR